MLPSQLDVLLMRLMPHLLYIMHANHYCDRKNKLSHMPGKRCARLLSLPHLVHILVHVSAIKVLSISIYIYIIPGFTTPLPLGVSGQNTCVTP